jgi:quinoprotein glucose dehydrogenase
VNRGVAYWSDGKPDGQRRVLLGVSDGRLFSLDARTGQPDRRSARTASPPRAGRRRRRRPQGRHHRAGPHDQPYGPTSAPAVFEDVVIVGCSNGEGHPAAPGDPRAFDVRTGRELWRFRTIPARRAGQRDVAQSDYDKDRGGANPWGGFTVDADRGIVFMGTGSAGPDFYGAGRKGENLYATACSRSTPAPETPVALPDHAPRFVGPRQPVPAGAVPRQRGTASGSTRSRR